MDPTNALLGGLAVFGLMAVSSKVIHDRARAGEEEDYDVIVTQKSQQLSGSLAPSREIYVGPGQHGGFVWVLQDGSRVTLYSTAKPSELFSK